MVWATPPQGSLLIIVITVVVINVTIIPFMASYPTLPRPFFIANEAYRMTQSPRPCSNNNFLYFYCYYLSYFSYCRQLKESLSFT